jgi:dipeptidyl aminopeptidase/acylaminoacyl peptidase
VIEHYLKIKAAYAGSLRHDHQRLAFLYNQTGSAQIWTLEQPLGWARQRTFFDDRLTFVSYSPTKNQYIYGRDVGGNEQDQFFLHNEETHQTIALTESPQVKHNWGAWDDSGERIAFCATLENDTDFFVYTMNLGTRQTTRVGTLGGNNAICAFRGEKILVSHYTSNTNNDLYLLDLTNGTQTHLTQHEGDVGYWNAQLSPDGKTVYCLCNLGREFTTLASINTQTQKLEFWGEDGLEQDDLALTHNGQTLAVLANVDGYSQMLLVDTNSRSAQPVTLPQGVAAISSSANCFSVTLDAPNRPINVFVVDENATVTAWTDVQTDTLDPSTLQTPELVKCQLFDGLEVSGLYYRPVQPKGKLPVIIIIHGGPESQSRPNFAALSQYFCAKGFAVLLPNVRGSTSYGKTFMNLDNVKKRMDSVADIKAFTQWLTNHGDADPKRIAVYGGSYGGFMVLSCLTTYPELFAAGVCIVGISNFVTFLERTSNYRRKVREAEYGSLEHDREFLQSISPITHIERLTAPLFILHGKNDPRVPLFEAEQLYQSLQARGVKTEFLVYDDEGHGIIKLKNRLDAFPKVAAFLEKHLDV